MNVDVETLKNRIPKIKLSSDIQLAKTNLSLEKIASINDDDIISNLSGSYNLAKMEYENFQTLVLPSVYVRGSRELPTMASSDGYQNITEVGLSFPIDSFFIRSDQKTLLGAKAKKAESLFHKALLDYRNQIRLNVINFNHYQRQAPQLEVTRKETKLLLDKSFLFYSQKRIDVLGAFDIFQKYLQAARNVLINNFQIQSTDAELEYLVGGGLK
jgi:outer membrane protein TolC